MYKRIIAVTILLAIGTLMLPIIAANAGVVMNYIAYDYYYVETEICSGDVVVLEGYRHWLYAVTEDSNGGWHLTFHVNPCPISGEVIEGPNEGAKCRGVGYGSWAEYVIPSGTGIDYPYTFTYRNVYDVIIQGNAPNLKVHRITHITINANGEITVIFDDWRVTCK